MSLITSAVVALLPVFVLAQSVPINTTSFGGYPSNQYALEYYRASHTTNVTNSVGFQGFNWTVPVDTGTSNANTTASNTWQMHLNYSTVVVPSSSGNVTTGNTVLSMTFPGREWPLDSDWRLCASFSLGAFPDSIASKGTNNSDSSCAPYLGQSCANALLAAYQAQTPSSRCPTLPGLSSISECSGVVDAFSGGIGTAEITNTTSPDLVYADNGYVNVTGTGPTYSRANVTNQGLSSGQAFGSFLSVYPNTNIAASIQTESRKVHLIALQINPSEAYRANSSGAYGWTPNARLVCARANASTSGAMGFREVPFGLVALGVMIAGFMGLW